MSEQQPPGDTPPPESEPPADIGGSTAPPAEAAVPPTSAAPPQPAAPPAPPAPGYAPPPTWPPQAATVPAAGPPAAYPPPPPAAYPPGYGYATAVTSTNAIIGLILAITSWVVCPIVPAIVALVLAAKSKQEIAASQGRVEGEGYNLATRIIAWLNIGIWSLLIVGFGIFFVIAVVVGATQRA